MKDFKVGDRVRFVGDVIWIKETILKGEDAIVYDISADNGKVWLKKTAVGRANIDEIELVDSPDPKTAFLTELQALLKKYDAKFSFYDVYDMSIEIGDESIDYGFLNAENSPNLTPDNIFNYDKD